MYIHELFACYWVGCSLWCSWMYPLSAILIPFGGGASGSELVGVPPALMPTHRTWRGRKCERIINGWNWWYPVSQKKHTTVLSTHIFDRFARGKEVFFRRNLAHAVFAFLQNVPTSHQPCPCRWQISSSGGGWTKRCRGKWTSSWGARLLAAGELRKRHSGISSRSKKLPEQTPELSVSFLSIFL